MSKKQRLAIKRMNRALTALDEAGISICGMDSDLLWATDKACEMHHKDYDYCPVANAVKSDADESGTLDANCYQESGGW